MHKLFPVLLVCFVIGLTLAGQGKDRSHVKKKDRTHLDHKPAKTSGKYAKFCSNKTLAQAYLTEVLSTINNLQSNLSYNAILNLKSANFINYISNTTNQGLLNNDCEAFIKGVKAAIKADEIANDANKYLASTILKKIKQVAFDVTNGKGFYELKS